MQLINIEELVGKNLLYQGDNKCVAITRACLKTQHFYWWTIITWRSFAFENPQEIRRLVKEVGNHKQLRNARPRRSFINLR